VVAAGVLGEGFPVVVEVLGGEFLVVPLVLVEEVEADVEVFDAECLLHAV
jgi:hypothetical protein